MLDGHGEAKVAKEVLRTLDLCEIKERLGYITTDIHGANDRHCDLLSAELNDWHPEERRLRCIGHIINLAVQSFLWAKVQEAVHLAARDFAATQLVQEAIESGDIEGWIKSPALQKILALQTFLRRSDRQFNAFKKIAGKAIRAPNDTRWNSYLNTFEDALDLRAAYTTFVISDAAFVE